uniref:Replication protein A 70 kDa DNA-binding subunit B/D first OB fold domain-containing protein n=1 Tax=Solanum lycopersicum TaxID=4081 RepID=K4CJU5_SOLLC
MAYSLLSELDTTKDNWLVRVRVCRMWEFRNYRRDNEMISLDMVLIDEKGTLIHGVIWKDLVTRFRQNLSDSVITIKNFKVSKVSAEEDRTVKGRITLWENFAKGFYPYLFNPESGPYVVIVTATTLKEFRGELTFATTGASKTYVNLPMDNITSLIQKFATKIVHIQTIDNTNAGNIPLEEAMLSNRMTDKEKMEDPSQSYVQNVGPSHTNNNIEIVHVGEDTSSSNIKVFSIKLKKRRKFLIDTEDEGNIDQDNNKTPNLKA